MDYFCALPEFPLAVPLLLRQGVRVLRVLPGSFVSGTEGAAGSTHSRSL